MKHVLCQIAGDTRVRIYFSGFSTKKNYCWSQIFQGLKKQLNNNRKRRHKIKRTKQNKKSFACENVIDMFVVNTSKYSLTKMYFLLDVIVAP